MAAVRLLLNLRENVHLFCIVFNLEPTGHFGDLCLLPESNQSSESKMY